MTEKEIAKISMVKGDNLIRSHDKISFKGLVPYKSVSKKISLLLGISAFLILLLLWSLATSNHLVNPIFLPTPNDTLKTMIDMFANGYFTDVSVTVFRVITGFVIALIFALPLGVLIGAYKPFSSFFEPLFSFIRYMPASAFIPLFILWIGIDEPEKVAVIILGSFPQLVLMIANNIRNVNNSLIEASYTLGTTTTNVLWKIILPKSLPDILDTIRIVIGWAWTYVIVAEMVGASSGIGYQILQSQRTMQVTNIFVGIFVLGVIGLIVDGLLKFLNRVLFPWNDDAAK